MGTSFQGPSADVDQDSVADTIPERWLISATTAYGVVSLSVSSRGRWLIIKGSSTPTEWVMQWMAPLSAMMLELPPSQSMPTMLYPGNASSQMRIAVVSYCW